MDGKFDADGRSALPQVVQKIDWDPTRLKGVLAAGGIACWSWDLVSGHVLWGGHRFGILEPGTELTGDEALVRMIHPGDRALLVEQLVRVSEQGEPLRCEFRLLDARGAFHWVSAEGEAERDESGRPIRLVGIARDVTARKEAEAALEKQRKEQQIILDSVPALIWYKDRNNRILQANAAAAESMGMSVEELAGRATGELYPEEAKKYHRDDLEVIQSGRPKLGIVELLQTASGEKRWVRTDKIPYRDENNEIIGVIVFAIDITERVMAEQALRRAHDELEIRVRERTAELAAAVEGLRLEIAEREKAEEKVRRQQEQLAHVQRLRTIEGVASQLAHEINQPLAAIVNFANGISTRLRTSGIDAATMGAASAQIREQAMRAGEVIRRLRGFVRKDTSRRHYVDVNDLVQEAAQLIELEAQRKGIGIRFCLDSALPRIQVDGVQIEQVIVNLLRNGIDAIVETGEPAGELVVTTQLLPEAVQVSIRDTGAGVLAGTEQRLFEPYYTTKTEGLGMGLSISRSIAEAHGGSLWAEPNADRGMSFLLRLPVPSSVSTGHEQKLVG